MYKNYEPLTGDELKRLTTLKNSVDFVKAEGYELRKGKNAPKVMSVYNFSKWFEWHSTQRKEFKEFFPTTVREKIVQGWFLELPAHDGFLDVIDYWVDKKHAGHVIATALKDQSIYLDGQEVVVRKGEQIGFDLRTIHELKASKKGQLWACVMFLDSYEDHND